MGGPLDSALSDLRARIVAMGGLVIEQVITAVQALLEGDAGAAALVLARERQVNACDTAIEEAGFQFIARRAPVAGDLRTVTAIARAVTDLERAGDEAKKIARLALAAAAAGDRDVSLGVHRHLRHMARLSADMLRAAVGALERADATVAHDVARMDRELDREFQAALRQLMTVAMENGRLLRSTIDTVLILKSLERIGDHAKNVAEHVVFLVSGDDVRHARAERGAAGGQSAVH
ncbi:MAG: phosphate signaling complex protein PhoU [Steroidobacteraceae bacterium]|nr:phosphate signaling complex protein PhoU [Steroidobacteraceae bacterium]